MMNVKYFIFVDSSLAVLLPPGALKPNFCKESFGVRAWTKKKTLQLWHQHQFFSCVGWRYFLMDARFK